MLDTFREEQRAEHVHIKTKREVNITHTTEKS